MFASIFVCLTARCPAAAAVLSAALLLLGSLRDWAQLEVWHGLAAAADRTNSGVPGLCGTIHVAEGHTSNHGGQVSSTQQQAAANILLSFHVSIVSC
jgi:hypothetical protein